MKTTTIKIVLILGMMSLVIASILTQKTDVLLKDILFFSSFLSLLIYVLLKDRKRNAFMSKALNPRFHPGDETLMLDALDGKETFIDDDFKEWGTDKSSIATKEQAVVVHELVKNATFAQMFDSLGTDLDKLCLTQAQIINFCKKYPEWLRKIEKATFFLFKVEDQFFIAHVRVFSDNSLYVFVYRFGNVLVWRAGQSLGLVVPQLVL